MNAQKPKSDNDKINSFYYNDRIEGRVRVVCMACNCKFRRSHPLALNAKRCCCKNLSCRRAFLVIALCLILYGIISYLIITILMLLIEPSAIFLILEFPIHGTTATLDSGIAIVLGVTLLIGYLIRSAKVILIVSWCLLLAYVIVICYIIAMVAEGYFVVDALVYGYYEKQYYEEGEVTDEYLICAIVYYLYLTLHIVLILILGTYAIIILVSFYDELVALLNAGHDPWRSKKVLL